MSDRTTMIEKRLIGLSNLAAWASVILYAGCLILPAYHIYYAPTNHEDIPGWFPLVFGPIMVVAGVPAWLANPLLWSAGICHMFSKYYATLMLAALSLVAALSFLTVKTLPAGTSDGRYTFELKIGYFVWITSIVFALLAAAFAIASRKYHDPAHSPARVGT